MRLDRPVAVFLVLLGASCGASHAVFHCKAAGDCNLTPGGVCIAGLQVCAYPVPLAECPSGYLYDGSSGTVANTCVPIENEGGTTDAARRADTSFLDVRPASEHSTRDAGPVESGHRDARADACVPTNPCGTVPCGGMVSNGCGTLITCPDICSASQVCFAGACCTPSAAVCTGLCNQLKTDSCGVSHTCSCGSGAECKSGNTCCTPTSTNVCLGYCSGTQTDSCGVTFTCSNACAGGQKCNATTHMCCTPEPTICADLCYTCGSVSDACGTSYPCGTCGGSRPKCLAHMCECLTCSTTSP